MRRWFLCLLGGGALCAGQRDVRHCGPAAAATIAVEASGMAAEKKQRGFGPRAPIPDVAAVLTERSGHTVTMAQLWPGRAEPDRLVSGAASGLDDMAGI